MMGVDSSNSQCVFTQETASWVQVDLGSYYMITEINLIGRSTTDSASASVQSTGWSIQVGTGGDGTDSIYADDIDASWTETTHEGARLYFSGAYGRYVRVVSGTVMVLCEIEIYGNYVHHDEENDCKICPYGKYQDEAGQNNVKTIPKPTIQTIIEDDVKRPSSVPQAVSRF